MSPVNPLQPVRMPAVMPVPESPDTASLKEAWEIGEKSSKPWSRRQLSVGARIPMDQIDAFLKLDEDKRIFAYHGMRLQVIREVENDKIELKRVASEMTETLPLVKTDMSDAALAPIECPEAPTDFHKLNKPDGHDEGETLLLILFPGRRRPSMDTVEKSDMAGIGPAELKSPIPPPRSNPQFGTEPEDWSRSHASILASIRQSYEEGKITKDQHDEMIRKITDNPNISELERLVASGVAQLFHFTVGALTRQAFANPEQMVDNYRRFEQAVVAKYQSDNPVLVDQLLSAYRNVFSSTMQSLKTA